MSNHCLEFNELAPYSNQLCFDSLTTGTQKESKKQFMLQKYGFYFDIPIFWAEKSQNVCVYAEINKT